MAARRGLGCSKIIRRQDRGVYRDRLAAVSTEAGAWHQGRAAMHTGRDLELSRASGSLLLSGLWDGLPAFAAKAGAKA